MSNTNITISDVSGTKPIDNTRELARGYIERGFSPVPVKFMGKHPNVPNWQNLRIKEHEIDQWFPIDPTNIGIILGDASSGLVDIDLDDDDAVFFAIGFLPHNDVIGQWITARCIINSDSQASMKELYTSYREWCANSAVQPQTDGVFGKELTRKGYQSIKRKTGNVRQGIALKPSDTSSRIPDSNVYQLAKGSESMSA